MYHLDMDMLPFDHMDEDILPSRKRRMKDDGPSSGHMGALTKSYSASACSQTTCSPAASEMDIPGGFRQVPSSTLMKSSTGIDRLQCTTTMRSKPPRRPRRPVDTTDSSAWLDDHRRLNHHCALRTFRDSLKERTAGSKAVSPAVSTPQQNCVTEAPRSKQHRTAYSLLQAHGSLLMSTCDDGGIRSPGVSAAVIASPPSSCVVHSKAPVAPSREQAEPISIHTGKESVHPFSSRNNVCRGGMPTAAKAPEQRAELPSMFDIWDYIQQGAGRPISSTAAASIAAFSCDGPFSMQGAVNSHAGGAAC